MASQPLAATEAGSAGGLPAVEPKKAAVTPVRIAAAAIVVAAVAAALFWLYPRPASVPAQPAAARVAVLPFDTLSDGPQARHFADALTDEIVTRLNSNRIQVVSRDDAATLRGADRDRKVAELGVSLLFDGTVQDDGKAVKVRVHLDDPVRHATLWSGSVDGPADNSDQLQASIASTIVAVLACSNRALVPAHGLTDPDLLSRYLHACDLFVNRTDSREDIYELLASLREVAAKAPDFAPAHSDLAKFALFFSPGLPPDQAAPLRQEAEAEAHKALALDPKSPDAYLALSRLLPPTDWAGREKLLRQGVAGDPDWPFTNGFLGLMLADTGRLQEAAGYLQKAAAADLQIDWRPDECPAAMRLRPVRAGHQLPGRRVEAQARRRQRRVQLAPLSEICAALGRLARPGDDASGESGRPQRPIVNPSMTPIWWPKSPASPRTSRARGTRPSPHRVVGTWRR